jgi:hypothetical protein
MKFFLWFFCGLHLALTQMSAAYDATAGRFVSRDPISESGGLNLYRYVDNSPANATDSLGLAVDLNLLDPVKDPVLNFHAKNYFGNVGRPEPGHGQGVYTVAGHGMGPIMDKYYIPGVTGTPLDASFRGIKTYYTAEMLGARIISDPFSQSSSTISLFVCYAGFGGKLSHAQALANVTRKGVWASSGLYFSQPFETGNPLRPVSTRYWSVPPPTLFLPDNPQDSTVPDLNPVFGPATARVLIRAFTVAPLIP